MVLLLLLLLLSTLCSPVSASTSNADALSVLKRVLVNVNGSYSLSTFNPVAGAVVVFILIRVSPAYWVRILLAGKKANNGIAQILKCIMGYNELKEMDQSVVYQLCEASVVRMGKSRYGDPLQDTNVQELVEFAQSPKMRNNKILIVANTSMRYCYDPNHMSGLIDALNVGRDEEYPVELFSLDDAYLSVLDVHRKRFHCEETIKRFYAENNFSHNTIQLEYDDDIGDAEQEAINKQADKIVGEIFKGTATEFVALLHDGMEMACTIDISQEHISSFRGIIEGSNTSPHQAAIELRDYIKGNFEPLESHIGRLKDAFYSRTSPSTSPLRLLDEVADGVVYDDERVKTLPRLQSVTNQAARMHIYAKLNDMADEEWLGEEGRAEEGEPKQQCAEEEHSKEGDGGGDEEDGTVEVAVFHDEQKRRDVMCNPECCKMLVCCYHYKIKRVFVGDLVRIGSIDRENRVIISFFKLLGIKLITSKQYEMDLNKLNDAEWERKLFLATTRGVFAEEKADMVALLSEEEQDRHHIFAQIAASMFSRSQEYEEFVGELELGGKREFSELSE